MGKIRKIQFSYRKIIDSQHTGVWEKMVLESAFMEYRLQFQNYDRSGLYTTYSDLLLQYPDAKRLPYLVSGAIIGYLSQLKEIIPDIIDNQGVRILHFERFHLEILQADMQHFHSFKIAITFFSETFQWHDSIADMMLISSDQQTSPVYHTHLIRIQPYLTITHLHLADHD
ncbi:hypothetical protein ACR79M_01615 [Sphingobacterium spiritivorum]|uniref:hypothetical protein n=1 Tax=Sphingobacterium spiritivorum TaxID=258 RepID=UPI00191A7193|nr:hypothetical protein [Sphingobacterium spiritivorum]QQT26045.1 hypothetical protein I6J02_20455 [Sphingobacterium spiritivorum]